jgi:transcriptional accessory protein Tex/SPT6
MKKEHLEPPFVIHHRQDYYQPYFKGSDIWKIYDLDEEYTSLQSKKTTLRPWSEKIPAISTLLSTANSEVELRDVADSIFLLYKKEVEEIRASQSQGSESSKPKTKRPSRRDFFNLARQSGLEYFGKVKDEAFAL